MERAKISFLPSAHFIPVFAILQRCRRRHISHYRHFIKFISVHFKWIGTKHVLVLLQLLVVWLLLLMLQIQRYALFSTFWWSPPELNCLRRTLVNGKWHIVGEVTWAEQVATSLRWQVQCLRLKICYKLPFNYNFKEALR